MVCVIFQTELSQALQSLSEKARSGTEYIQRLRSKSETIKLQILESERHVEAQLTALITALENKKCELTERLRQLRESKVLGMKEQIGHVTALLTRSTGLIQFCIEMLKETDPSAFLVVSQSLIMRAQKAEQLFAHEHDQAVSVAENTESLLKGLRPCTGHRGYLLEQSECDSNRHVNSYSGVHEYEFGLKMTVVETIQQAIDELCLHEDRTPIFLPDECITERNVITLVWQPTSTIPADRYTLELDDGANGNFRKVYRGPETICTVEGLHFRSVYRARVKAHNSAGESSYSDRLCLQTADLTWFHLESSTAPPEILLTNGNRTVTSQVAEDRVVLGSTGLSRGMHYWEFTVDRCDIGGQPAFGIARQDTNRETMLGSDMRSWSVYFDYKRSWFLHNGEHFERTDGGVRAGSVVGVRLDCDRGSLSYYLNDEPHGPIAFTNLPPGVYYPAVSLSRAVQLTLHTGLEAPSESEESDEDSSGAGTGTETTSMATTVLGHTGTHSFTTPFTLTKQ
ncbi:hypothetical protein P879_01304 [Paragonimus westermani]|uniref:Tripartite motif-containing protein 9/67 n=1 Tax=Paragonimus westermani TaxID=34504 RepID=A0A8T0DXZ3_9TREM|nr:hypothetical protein P879_01304 [Paragonimus westermani]